MGLGVGVGLGLGVGIGLGVGVAIGFGIGVAKTGVGLGRGDAIGSRLGVGIGSKRGVAIGSNVKGSGDSGGGVALGRGGRVGAVASAVGDAFLFWKGAEAASCARTSGEAARKTVAMASKRMMFLKLFPLSTDSDASPRSSPRSSRIDFAKCQELVEPNGGSQAGFPPFRKSVGLSTHLLLNLLPHATPTLFFAL